MTAPQGSPYDVWVEFNDLREDGTVVVHADDFADVAKEPQVGERLVAGDDEGNRCPATVETVSGARITLQLDLDRFQAPTERPAQ